MAVAIKDLTKCRYGFVMVVEGEGRNKQEMATGMKATEALLVQDRAGRAGGVERQVGTQGAVVQTWVLTAPWLKLALRRGGDETV